MAVAQNVPSADTLRITFGELVGIQTAADGALAATFYGRLDDEAVELIFHFSPAQVEALRRHIHLPGGVESDRWSQADAEARVLYVLEDPARGTPPGTFVWNLIHLIARADPDSLARLRLGFPEFVGAYERWQRGALQPAQSAEHGA